VPDLLGYRAKMAVVVPSTNTTMEPELHAMAPCGVTIHQKSRCGPVYSSKIAGNSAAEMTP